MSFHSPLAFLMSLTIPVILLLYMLKQRFEEQKVSSIYLWQQALNEMEASAPWQKLKKNILMLLQIAAMLLLIMALASPFIKGLGKDTANLIIAIDTSMSMQAVDTKPSRFYEAKKRAAELIENMEPETMVTLITIGADTIVEESRSTDKSTLLNIIDSLEVTNAAGNIDDSADIINSLAEQFPDTETVVIGDTVLEADINNYSFIDVGSNGDNYALVNQAHATGPESVTALTGIKSFSNIDAEIELSLYVDGYIFDSRKVNVESGKTENIYWEEVPLYASQLECRIENEDSLEADNRIYDVVSNSEDKKAVLVTDKNIFIEKALSLIDGLKLYKTTYEDAYDLSGYELFIYDGVVPENLPEGSMIFINPGENEYFQIIKEIKNPELLTPAHDMLKNIVDFPFTIASTSVLEVPMWGEELLGSESGTVMFCGEYENRRMVVFGFDVHDSNIVLKPAFPILISDVVEWLLPDRITKTADVYPNQAVELNLNPAATEVYVTSPEGNETRIAPPFPAGAFEESNEIGIYKLVQQTEKGVLENYFTVNPPESESDLKLKYVQKDNEEEINDSSVSGSEGLSLYSLILSAALLILLIEWWLYSNAV